MNFDRGKWIGFGVSGLFVGLIGLAVFAPSTDSVLAKLFFSKVCHQLTDRSYHLHGIALPVCVRCIWIYAGFAIGHVLFLFWKPNNNRITQALIGVIALMIMDVGFELAGLYNNLFWTRAVSGFLFGLVVSRFTLLGLREIYCELSNPVTYVRSRFFKSGTR
jgi:uncharacterized membrane protein